MRRLAIAVTAFVLMSIDARAYRTAVWVAAWEDASLVSVQTNASRLSETNPVWYTLDASGAIAKQWNAENPTWRAAMAGTELLPTIQNIVNGKFDGPLASAIVDDASRREAHAEALTQLVITNAFDGIDIDYEALASTSRAGFTAFVATLATKLHSAGKKLSITVHPKTSDSQNWKGPGSQDWIAIGRSADFVKIMAYDHAWATSAAGPIAPIDWLEKVVAYAVSTIPQSKIIVGLPWYGYDWVGTAGKGITYPKAIELARAKNVTPVRDANGELLFQYDGTHTVYFQDAESFRRKSDAILAKFPAIGGFTAWRTGSEESATWSKMEALKNASGSGATIARGDFVVSGSDVVEIDRGSSTTTTLSVTPIDGFSDAISVAVTSLDGTLVSGSVDRTSVRAGETVTLRLSALDSAVPVDHRIRVTFTSGTIVKTKDVILRVFMTQSAPARTGRKRSGRR